MAVIKCVDLPHIMKFFIQIGCCKTFAWLASHKTHKYELTVAKKTSERVDALEPNRKDENKSNMKTNTENCQMSTSYTPNAMLYGGSLQM